MKVIGTGTCKTGLELITTQMAIFTRGNGWTVSSTVKVAIFTLRKKLYTRVIGGTAGRRVTGNWWLTINTDILENGETIKKREMDRIFTRMEKGMKEGGRETKNTVLVHTNIEMGIVTVDNGATTTVTAKASWTTTTAPHIPVDGKRASSKAGALSRSLLETTIPDSGRAAKCMERGLL
jgi:hypothetical protein